MSKTLQNVSCDFFEMTPPVEGNRVLMSPSVWSEVNWKQMGFSIYLTHFYCYHHPTQNQQAELSPAFLLYFKA